MTHPEQAKNEVFVGNVRTTKWPRPEFHSLKTARIGTVAYDIDGNELTAEDGMSPMFVGTSEAARYNNIMEAAWSRIMTGA